MYIEWTFSQYMALRHIRKTLKQIWQYELRGSILYTYTTHNMFAAH